ncbi:hypothetical protein HO173_005070 [Letharia columbiana]|uniref:Uncharacterized protein n=1 Tax=Letharia columbiana TaxID=112416 RepID=A0A8H6FXP4_9LECA|nr:uncharacterized protein HO173_005070 [Letharia columbiana]KAF6236779.1 hypothetical protein HO173_005070 [Letharia columbiana]
MLGQRGKEAKEGGRNSSQMNRREGWIPILFPKSTLSKSSICIASLPTIPISTMHIEISLADDIASQPSSIDLEMPTPPQDVRDVVLVDRKPGAADQPVPTGMTLGSKELYREDERYPWDDWSPDDIDLDPEETPEE